MTSILLFLHVPRTGGTTFDSILSRHFAPDKILTLNGGDMKTSVKMLKAHLLQSDVKIQLLKGHMPFGLHMYLTQPVTYITFLRHPVDRIISHYYYVKNLPGHYLHEVVASKDLSLEDYAMADISSELSNGQTRLISACQETTLTEETLDLAKENLSEQFSFVGLTERFDESLLLLARRLGWRNIFYLRHNMTQNRPRMNNVPENVIAQIKARNTLDSELYEFANQMFNEAVSSYGKTFNRDVRIFQLQNRIYQNMYQTARTLWRGISSRV